MTYKPDCRFFNGEKPCQFKRLCEGCEEYIPMGKRILILKLAAMVYDGFTDQEIDDIENA